MQRLRGCNENSKTDARVLQRNHSPRRCCSYPRCAGAETNRVPGLPAPPAGAADDLTGACCSDAMCWLAKLIFGAHHDAATNRPTVAAHIRVQIFYRRRDQTSAESRLRRRAMPRSCEHFHAAIVAANVVREA